jgi:predicted thioesterase
MAQIKPGLVGETTITVTKDQTAQHLGSGSIDVYATPAMVALMEQAALSAIDPLLDKGQASVGTALDIKHLAATPLGHTIRAQAEVTEVDRRRVTFRVQAWDEKELIGEGTHTRFIIDIDRFLDNLQAKAK